MKKIEANLKLPIKQVKEEKMEDKTYIVKCTKPECLFQYETQNPNQNKNVNSCQVCGNMNLEIKEK